MKLIKTDVFGRSLFLKKWIIRLIGGLSHRRFKGINNLQISGSEKIKNLVKNQVDRAKQFYALAINTLPIEDKKSQKIGLIMGNIYFVLLNEIVKDNPEKILNQKTILPGFRKLRISILTMLGFSWIKNT